MSGRQSLNPPKHPPPSFHSSSGAPDCLSSCLSAALEPEGSQNTQPREAEPGEEERKEEGWGVGWRKPVETTTRTGDQEEGSSCNAYMLLAWRASLSSPKHTHQGLKLFSAPSPSGEIGSSPLIPFFLLTKSV